MNNWLFRNIILPSIQFSRKENFIEYLKQSRDIQYISKSELHHFQWTKLQQMLKHAFTTVPYYKDKYNMTYCAALKQGNQNRGLEKWHAPRKGTEEYDQVIAVMMIANTLLTHIIVKN